MDAEIVGLCLLAIIVASWVSLWDIYRKLKRLEKKLDTILDEVILGQHRMEK